jgi:hypothetical protein
MLALALATASPVATAQTIVPEASNSALYGCPIPGIEFRNWFVTGSVTVNGMVGPPDNVNFLEKGDCSFYQRAAHMFLWVTSPPLPGYGAGSYVFESPVFFEVSPPIGDQPSALAAQSAEQRHVASASIPKRGPDGQPVVVDNAGKMYPIVHVQGGSHPFIDTDGQKVEIGNVTIGSDGTPVFLDTFGSPIKLKGDEILRLLDIDRRVIGFKTPPVAINSHGQVYFLDQLGRAIAAGSGQSDEDRHVLMLSDAAQDKKLVYYLTHVNDIYTFFLTGQKNGRIVPPPTRYPSNAADLGALKTYARMHGKNSFVDDGALVVEVKSSWIELPNAKDYADYISIKAQVPDFDPASDILWKRKGLRSATLAMVGMHIAFSVQGHSELVWATFEHMNNAPNPRYQYRDRASAPTLGPWLFSSGRDNKANQARMVMNGNDIQAIGGKTIGPSDVLRLSPWGWYQAEFTTVPNTQVISTNNNVQGRLVPGDVRKNYILIGATWGAKSGSRNLANSTMETFVQPATCLDCHDVNTHALGTTDAKGRGAGLSHIYGALKPFFPDP